jgi:diguanylate cyclase (GGDEF)-like protein
MSTFNSANLRLSLRIALPALAILVGTVATVLVSLNRMAGEVDNVAKTLTMRSAAAAVQSVLHRIGLSHNDYSEWDDAVRNLYGGLDPQFLAENFDSATEWAVLFDTVYILDEDKQPVAARRLGKPIDLPLEQAFGPAIAQLLDGLPDDGRTYEVRTGIVSGAWGPGLVAVGPIVADSEDFEYPPDRSRYLVIGRSLDETAIDELAQEFVLSGLRLVKPGESVPDKLDLVDPAGHSIAALTWPPAEMGTRAYAEISPAVILTLLLLGITIVVLIVVAYRSITEIKKSEDQARYAAAHDALSGLPNRAELLRRLADIITAAGRDDLRGALIFLDLDGFKRVNDSYGHDIGDRLLRKVADGFHTICDDYPVARVGGDEFAVLLVDKDPLQAAMALGCRLIRYLTQPIDIDGRVVVIGTSLGIATIDEAVPSADEVLRRADIAMYQAKQQGRNRIVVYDSSIDSARDERLAIAADLRTALRSGDLEIAYQPIVDATTRRIVGAEALLRWPRPGAHPVPPSVFVPIAEESGLIDELGAWTLRQACSDGRGWPGIRVSVNVSPAQFRNPNFDVVLSTILGEVGFAPERLELEVTETYLVANPSQASQSINAIRNLGVTVALDDFGSGFSSIGYLRSFTFDKLKLDRSLIAGIAADQRVQRFVQATIAMADALDLEVVAEGVETEEEASLLGRAGCREFQGFHLAKPCSAAEFSEYLSADAVAAGSPAVSA